MNTEYILYLDMDGVLSDFDKGCELLPDGIYGYPVAEYEWWVDLEWMPHGKSIWKIANRLFKNIHLLSSRGISDKEREAAIRIDAGKRGWAKKNLRPTLPDDRIHTVESVHGKAAFAAENAILVDDRGETIDDWEEAGGIGVHYNDNYYRNAVLELIRISRQPIKLSSLVKRNSP